METKAVVPLLCLLALALPLSLALTDRGVAYLDDLTFDKVVDGSRDVFVRFDKEYAWGDEHDAFKEAAKTIGESGAGVLTAGVPVSKRDYEPQNAGLAERFGVDEPDFPAYRLYVKGQPTDKPLSYPKGRGKKADDLLAWVASNTGAFFGLKGQIKELDALARKLVAAKSAKDKAAVVKEGEAAAAKISDAALQEAAKYYAKAMAKAAEKPEWPASESKRLSGLLGGQMSADKKETMEVKVNVLASFLGGGSGADAQEAARKKGEL